MFLRHFLAFYGPRNSFHFTVDFKKSRIQHLHETEAHRAALYTPVNFLNLEISFSIV